ncbi:uncharacterized protein N7511_008671 [Penicillium nucicola]|uniref:uncharacterized protein n=1 Tax=Penicillium nucicola TaxID=1850975 RepID=UPI00254547BE|nr:uncharacterized protein N7511_008671 [Penicillium nucicola]KAJ5746975.1 hypothetical protein N7511_008671 [Penicillium nucicola]
MAMVSKSISILEKGIQSPKICLSAPDPYCDSINQVIGTLQMLQSYVSQHVRRSTTITNVISAPDVGSDVLDNFDDTNWGGNALGALNYMTSTDWASETEGPFMGFMELES